MSYCNEKEKNADVAYKLLHCHKRTTTEKFTTTFTFNYIVIFPHNPHFHFSQNSLIPIKHLDISLLLFIYLVTEDKSDYVREMNIRRRKPSCFTDLWINV